ncbi:MAG: hypothetical protein AB8G99_00375 [Planctomycetaceae bacterium]
MSDTISTFDDLAASRRNWIQDVLRPWCQTASRKDLLKAESEWEDIAGKAAPEQTLWTWAWERFPALVYEGLTGVNETQQVAVRLKDETQHSGFPDGRRTERGQLYLLTAGDMQEASTADLFEAGPFSIDDISEVSAA